MRLNEVTKVHLSKDPNNMGADVDEVGELEPTVMIPIRQIRYVFEPDDLHQTKPRAPQKIRKMVKAIRDGKKMPPILVRKHGDGYQVLDGHHRFKAYRIAKVEEVPARIIDQENITGDVDEAWSNKYKRGIDCKNPKGFSQKAHCDARRKRAHGGKTESKPVRESFDPIRYAEKARQAISIGWIDNVLERMVYGMSVGKVVPAEPIKDLMEENKDKIIKHLLISMKRPQQQLARDYASKIVEMLRKMEVEWDELSIIEKSLAAGIDEARSHPELNPKRSMKEVLDSYLEKLGAASAYVHFGKIEKIGIKPRSHNMYGPQGVYAFPLENTLDTIKSYGQGYLQRQGTRYYTILVPTSDAKILDLDTVYHQSMLGHLNAAVALHRSKTKDKPNTYQSYIDASKDVKSTYRSLETLLSNYCRRRNKNLSYVENAFWRSRGVDAIRDTNKVVNDNPNQIVFLTPGSYRVIETLPLRTTDISENFADGKGPGRPGDSRRHGIPKHATLTQLDKIGKGSGRKAQLARWQANMRRGRAKVSEAIAPHGDPDNELKMMKAGTKPAALLLQYHFDNLYKPIIDKMRWEVVKFNSGDHTSYVVAQPGQRDRAERIARLVTDANKIWDAGKQVRPEYHRELGTLLGYSKTDIEHFIKNMYKDQEVNEADKPKVGHDAALTVFDIDETLFHTQAKVLVVKDGKVVKELDNREFNTYILEPSESFDFTQFTDARFFHDTSVPIEKMWDKAKNILDKVGRRPGSQVIIVTARSDFDDKETFLDTFRKHGLDIDKVHVHRAGNLNLPSAQAKKIIIKKYLDSGRFDMVRLFDDAESNLRGFLSLRDDFPDITFKAYMVVDDGSVREYRI